MDEISILKNLNHPSIIQLHQVFDEATHYYLVTEIMTGGDLFDRIVKKETYSEREARYVSKALFSAVEYIHKQNIAHRDLKPQNLLLLVSDTLMPYSNVAVCNHSLDLNLTDACILQYCNYHYIVSKQRR